MNDNDIAAGVDSYLGNERRIKETTIRDNFVNAAGTKPDDFSRQIELSKRTGIPVQSLIANPDEAAKHSALTGTDFSGLVLDSPLTADFLTDPKNAGVARDDVGSLSAMERPTNRLKAIFGAFGDVIPSINTGVWGLAQAASENFIEPFTNVAGSSAGRDISSYFKRLRGQAEAASKDAQSFGGNREDMGVLGRGALNAITSSIQSILTLPAGLQFQAAKGTLALSSALRAVAPLAAVQGGTSYGEARDKGVGKNTALAYAGGQAATEIWTEMIPMGKLIKDLNVGSSLFKTLRNQLVEENVGEQFATHFQDLNTWLTVNPEKTFGDYLAERPNAALETLVATTFAAGMQTTAAHTTARLVQNDIVARETAKEGAQHITDLFAAAAGSLVAKRSPDTLQSFVEHVAPGGTVLIDSDKLNEVLLQTGVDVSVLPSAVEQLATGEVSGSGLEIPLSELVRGLSGTEAEAAIIPHLRMSAELPTLAEEQAFGKQAMEFFQAKADEVLEKEAQNADFQLAAKAVQDDLFTQLTAVGRHGPQVNTGYAKLGAAFYSVLANDLGVTPVQVRDGYTDANGREHRGYKLRIGGEPSTGTPLAQGFSHGEAMLNIGLDVGATDRTQKIDAALVKQELEKLGVTVLSGTEIDSPYEKDGETFVEKTYVPHLSRPLTEAEVNHIADVLQQEAIPQYHRGAGNLWGPKAAEWGDFNPEFFKDQSGRSLLSAQGPKQTETPAFKKWFGDWQDPEAFSSRYPKDKTPVSQAVDAKGAPLVLYHSTNADITTFETGRKTTNNYGFLGDVDTTRHGIFATPEVGFSHDYLRGGGGGNVMPIYMDIKAPLDLRNGLTETDEVDLEAAGVNVRALYNSHNNWELFDDENGKDFVEKLKAAGYDGAIIQEEGRDGESHDTYVVFEPTQIKSAIGNRGTFDPNDPSILNQGFGTVPEQVVEAYRREEAWTEEGSQNGFPTWKSANVELANPRDVTEGHDVFYMPQNGERAVKYDILNPEGKVVGNTVLEIVDGWPTMLLDIETKPTERSKRYAEHTIAAIANDVGELAIWHIIPSARSWWDRQGATPVDEFNGSLTFETYADARANRDNPQGVGDPIGFYQSQSTRRPTTKVAPEDHLGEVPLVVDYTKIEPAKTAQNMALVSKYPGLRFKARDPAKRAEEFIQHVTSNLLWLHDQIPAAVRQRSKLWYDGANIITKRWAEKYGKTDAQIAAVLAVYSPQKDWFMNVSLAERTLDIVRDQQNTPWSPKMQAVSEAILAKPEFALLRSRIEGKSLGELTDRLEQAAWVRVYDEAHNNRGHRLVTPEGGFGEFVQSGKGKNAKDAKTGWPGFSMIIKALYILDDASPKTIDAALGGEHKVRSFYNNIFHPTSDRGFVTIDTHAVAAGLLRPLSGNSVEVTHNFGSGGVAQSAKTGMSGTYPYYQEAYRRAAEARGLLPREMQSIAWEAVRELYTMGFKHDQAKLTELDNLWTRYEKGLENSSLDDTRRAILSLTGGVEQPAWVGRDPGLSAGGWSSTYTNELLKSRVPGPDRGTASGRGSATSGSDSQVLNQAAPLVRAGAVSAPVVGVHFSRQPRTSLGSSYFGTGIKGAEAERLAQSNDNRIKQRIAFYIDEGSGVHPEPGVGGAAHVATLTNLYDADADTLKIFRHNSRDLNAAESAILDAGFDGYLQRKNFSNQGTAVLLGSRSVEAEHVGGVEDANARATVPPPAEIPALKTLSLQFINDRTLPGGALTAAEWEQIVTKRDAPIAKLVDWTAFDPDERYYKDEIARQLWQTSDTWYYSQLKRAIENASEKIFTTGASVKQWLVSNAGKLGVKKEELEFTGITDWLELQGKVSKADVVAFMREGGVKVEEVVLGTKTVQQAREALRRDGYSTEELARLSDAATLQAAAGDEAKFASYVLPGGKSYRELLITLPDKARPLHDAAMRKYGGDLTRVTDMGLLRRLDEERNSSVREKFHNQHFDQPNILAHIRFNERTDAEGARVLFVEEIQSDWGQQGKKEGFATKYKASDITLLPDTAPEAQAPDRFWYFEAPGNVLQIPKSQYATEEAARAYVLTKNTTGATTPTGPFVTDTKAWTGLAVKRVLAYAAENGFDKVAWTTGEQQAERYDLSKQVDEIVALPNTDGTYDLTINLESGGSQQLRGLTESGLEDNIGKDLAKKIVSDSKEYLAANKAYRNALKEGATEDVLDRLLAEKDAVRRTYSGLDLKVGGEGMKGFYDGILPQVVRDVLKKVGGGQVEDVQLASAAFENAEDDELLAELGAATEGARPKYQPGFTITPEMREAVSKGLPLFQPTAQAPKLGSFDPTTLDLRLLADANYTTFVHELGHFFLTVYADVAAQEGAPQRVVDGMAAILKQFGIADLATWHAMTLEQQRPYHEQLAESFEQYVMTGKAPSLELQPLFSTMLAWFKKVYQSVKDFVAGHSGARLNPELATIFDRMLATDTEIALANATRGYVALFANAAEAGMSDTDFAAYTALSDAQREDAEAMLRSRSLRDMKWLQARRNKIIATLQEEAKEKRAEMRKLVAAEVKAEPIRQAERYLKHGKILNDVGADIAPLGPNKLQISEVKALYPEEALTPQPDFTKLGYGKYGMLVETGLSPEEVAQRFGLPSGAELVDQLLGLTKLNDEIEARTDQRMLEQYGDLSSPQAMARAADEAIHNDFRTRAVATELSALAANIGSPTVLMKAAKEYARQVLATKTSKTLKPYSYAAAETRAGKAAMAALKKGDRVKAAEAKRTELVNHVTAKESYAVEKEIKKIVDRFRKLAGYNNESSAVKSRDFATVQAVRAILADHGIGSKGESAEAYLDLVKEYDPAAAARLEDIIAATSANPKDWTDITVENLRELSEAIDTMWFLAARGKQMEVQGKMVSQKAIAEELQATLVEQGIPARVPGEGWAPTSMEKLKMKFGAWKATMRRMEFIASHLDGQRVAGPWLRNIVSVVQDALANMNIAKGQVFTQYEKLLDTIRPSLVRGEIAAPELGYVFGRGPGGSGRAELLHAILHTGNESNMRKMLLGRQWATEFQDGSLNTAKWDQFITRMKKEGRLTKADYDFAQGVWDLMESLKPAAQKAHRIVFGKYFSEITAQPFKNEFGSYAGGYVPALTDPDIVKDNDLRKLQEAALNEMTFAFPAPAKGFTNARVEGYTRELKLNLNSLSGHISQVLLFSHMAVPVNDIRRVLSRPEIANNLNRLYPGLIVEAINPWLVRVAKNTVAPLTSDLGKFLRLARSRAGTNTMMGSLSNAIQQVVGILPASVAIKGKYLRRAVVDSLMAPNDTVEFVQGLSPYMRTRMSSEVNAAMDNVEEILTNPNVYQSTVAWTRRHAYFLQSAVDNALSPMLWMGAFNQALDQGATEADAVHVADSSIRKTQGASGAADIAAFEAGHPFTQLFTQFTGYFNMMAQFLQGELVKNIASDVGLPKKYARAFYIVGIGFYAQAVAAELVSMVFRGGPADDDKDDDVIDDWLFQLGIMAPSKFLLSTVPFLGSAMQVVVNKWNTKPYDDKMLNSPVVSTLEQGLGAPVAVYKAVLEEGKPSVAVRSVAGIVGLFTGLPTSMAARPIGYGLDVMADKVHPTSTLDFARGIITGTASPDSKK